MIDPRMTHHLEQTGGQLSEMATVVIGPFYRALYRYGLPESVCIELTTALIHRMVEVRDVRQS